MDLNELNRLVVSAAPVAEENLKQSNRSIGAMLIDAGRLTLEDTERILKLQRESGFLFGDAALKLGILTQADIDYAMSRQYYYPHTSSEGGFGSKELIAAYQPFSAHAEALRSLRCHLLLRWFDSAKNRKALAIVSPEKGEGRSYTAANLAIVFAQLGERTLLIDANLRDPRQHWLFELENRNGLSRILTGRSGDDAIQKIDAQENLFVLTSGPHVPHPQELLSRMEFEQFLQHAAKRFDVILLDTPAGAEYADALAITARAGAALLIIRKNHTRASSAQGLVVDLLNCKAGVTLIGSVLNEF